ncbi:ABC transporter permease [Parabacteroides sp. PF5-9]|uniref:ABC transporter permease n=1 Tax=Parabacteroides sp. PF5-9 TaxID=1742404 RepID=UPI002473F447|nr:ABC transporter permease [Parabacteroides sp. PF5-9]MDH6357818.1 putative ABC transport system permease protein [Parabacteroides sp. PF5-9]
MIHQYIKQAWYMLRENKLLSIISILGTALAICMIMIIVILYEVNTANISPEIHRNQTYYLTAVESIDKTTNRRQSYGFMGLPFIKECFYTLESAEVVTAVSRTQGEKLYATTMDGNRGSSTDVLFTDGYFWDIFAFDFIAGKPFEYTAAEAGMKTLVINETLARRLFGSTDVTGKEMKLNYIVYTISGVVRDVSRYADKTYADIWIPYHAGANTSAWCDGINGNFNCYILKKPEVSRETFHNEVSSKVATFNGQTPQFRAEIGSQPFSHLEYWLGGSGNHQAPDLKKIFMRYGMIIIVLLLVPALNLSGITLAQMRKRISELGVRRAFGATTGNIMWQVLTENLLLTLVGGFFGLLFSYLGMVLFKDWLLMTTMGQSGLTGGMFNPVVFLIALAFCLVMNLLSAGIPAWRVSRVTVVESIKEE